MFSIERCFDIRTAEIRELYNYQPSSHLQSVSKMTKNTIIIYFVLLAAGAVMPGPSPTRDPPGGASEDCPAGWFQTTEGCYLFLDSEVMGEIYFQLTPQGGQL